MVAKLTRMTHIREIQLHLVAQSCTFAILVPGSQSRNFWIHPRTLMHHQCHNPWQSYEAESQMQLSKSLQHCYSTLWRNF